MPVELSVDRDGDDVGLGLLLRLLHQHWTGAVDEALVAAGFDGIRPPHASVFANVAPEGIQVSELAARASVRKQSMAQAVEELERAGYVERRPDPHDRRGQLVFLTERGSAVQPLAGATGRQVERRWADLIGPDELASLRRSLRALLSAVQAVDRAPA